MLPAIGFGLLLLSWLAVASSATPGRLERVSLFGNDYVRIEQWASFNGLKVEGSRGRELRVSGKGNSFVFEADSVRISANGIVVHLSVPVAGRNGALFVSPLDVSSTLEPILYPAQQSKKLNTICLDPGHGGKDPGFLVGKEQEKKQTLLLSREVGDQLGKLGFKVSYTRTSDTFVDLGARAEIAQRRGADLFVSLHFNSAGRDGEAVKGVETYCMAPARTSSTNARGEGSSTGSYSGNRFDAKNALLAYHVQKSLVTRLGADDRGVKRARYAVLRTAEMPAILIESGFLSNRAESRRIYDPKYRKQLAQAIVQGIQDYKRAVYREASNP